MGTGVGGTELHDGTRGLLGIVTYPERDWIVGAPRGGLKGLCDREYGSVPQRTPGDMAAGEGRGAAGEGSGSAVGGSPVRPYREPWPAE